MRFINPVNIYAAMVEGKLRSRTFRRIFVKTPGNKVVIHYKRRKPGFAECSNCRAKLKGVPRARVFELRAIPKTAKRPERPFGGVLCSSCSRQKIISLARK